MKKISYLTFLLIFSLLSVSTTNAQKRTLLGVIDFPNSGTEKAQSDFIEGVKLLHNFEYADAARAFRRAQDIDPDFALAYWGEAKSYNHPIWQQQDSEAANKALNRLGQTVDERQSKARTQREKDYLMSLEILYGNTPESAGKSKQERDLLYLEEMEDLHSKYPNDYEITAFYGLSILGSAHEGRDFAIYMRAAAELFDVWNKNQKHPGAAHYLIHSFDDPIHAPLGLPMARAYSKIAPSAAHAQHMTSHIFLAMGMWEEVVSANIVARNVQTSRQKELNEKTTVCGHYPWWLEYGYLQEGDSESAAEVLATCEERIKETPTNSEKWHYGIMRAHYIIDSKNWAAVNTWEMDTEKLGWGSVDYYFTNALAGVKTGNLKDAKENLDSLMTFVEIPSRADEVKHKSNQIKALLLIEEDDQSAGIEMLKKEIEYEFSLPIEFGPPEIVKPSSELLGEVYLKLGMMEEAKAAFEAQLKRTPKRRISLLGLNSLK
jgi:tetratricopeptide (TPR) repeat protein